MYRGTFNIFRRYWRAYGGTGALVRSPYLHVAIVGLVLTTPFWLQKEWWEQVLSVIPNLLGFTLGGFAVFLGFGDEKFRALLSEPDEEDTIGPSQYMKLCATFVHFIVLQALSLFGAILAKALNFKCPWPDGLLCDWVVPAANAVGSAIGYGLFLYAVTSILAATMHVFRIAGYYDSHQRLNAELAEREINASEPAHTDRSSTTPLKR